MATNTAPPDGPTLRADHTTAEQRLQPAQRGATTGHAQVRAEPVRAHRSAASPRADPCPSRRRRQAAATGPCMERPAPPDDHTPKERPTRPTARAQLSAARRQSAPDGMRVRSGQQHVAAGSTSACISCAGTRGAPETPLTYSCAQAGSWCHSTRLCRFDAISDNCASHWRTGDNL